jgi:hypothetical protein
MGASSASPADNPYQDRRTLHMARLKRPPNNPGISSHLTANTITSNHTNSILVDILPVIINRLPRQAAILWAKPRYILTPPQQN